MMKKKNGFTLVEVMAVIVILGILMTLAGTAAFKIIDEQQNALLNEQIKSIGDTAITYVESKKWYLRDCPASFDETNPLEDQKNKCYREVSVKDLIDSNFFENKNDLCKLDQVILVYKKNEGSYSNLKSYVKEGTCSY